MITQQILIGNIPSILWGNDSSRLYLYVHGQGGNKEEASILGYGRTYGKNNDTPTMKL